MRRRTFLFTLPLIPAALSACTAGADEQKAASEAAGRFEVTRTKEEWRKILTPQQFRVLREHDTERPRSSPLNDEHRAGTYHCAGCDLALYSSGTKFESGTGWPSFFEAIPGHVKTQEDTKLFAARTEYHCAKCGGHQGHVFDDGPKPTGLRYCNNGVAIAFEPDAEEKK